MASAVSTSSATSARELASARWASSTTSTPRPKSVEQLAAGGTDVGRLGEGVEQEVERPPWLVCSDGTGGDPKHRPAGCRQPQRQFGGDSGTPRTGRAGHQHEGGVARGCLGHEGQQGFTDERSLHRAQR